MGKLQVLDGGFSNELNKISSFNVHNDPLWTARALRDDTDAIVATHKAYVEAGADIIETSTFQATIQGFSKHWNLSEQEGEELIASSVHLARQAVEQSPKKILIAGSIGPYGAYLCDGSEYRGDYMDKVTEEELIALHLPRIRGLVKGGSDFLLPETIPSLKEAQIILELIKTHFPDTKVWISFSVKSGDSTKTPRDEDMKLVFESVTKYPQVQGFGINCCRPQDIQPFLDQVVPLKKRLLEEEGREILIIVYPNSGDDWIQGQGWIKLDIPTVDKYVENWASSGANVIGGCCEVGPEEIKNIRLKVDKLNLETEN